MHGQDNYGAGAAGGGEATKAYVLWLRGVDEVTQKKIYADRVDCVGNFVEFFYNRKLVFTTTVYALISMEPL